MNREIYKQQLIEEIMEKMVEKEQELQHRKRRLEENLSIYYFFSILFSYIRSHASKFISYC